MKSPLYHSPTIYETIMPLWLGKTFKKRVNKISHLLEGKRVMEIGCGTGLNEKFLKNCNYVGLDLNEKFVNYGKARGRNVKLGDAFDVPLGGYDSILFVDILHHIPNHEKVLKKALRTKKEVIVCEPFDKGNKNKFIEAILNRIGEIIDSDGINPPFLWYNKNELKRFFENCGSCIIHEAGDDLIAHYLGRVRDKLKRKLQVRRSFSKFYRAEPLEHSKQHAP